MFTVGKKKGEGEENRIMKTRQSQKDKHYIFSYLCLLDFTQFH